jgi:hypothetical protein
MRRPLRTNFVQWGCGTAATHDPLMRVLKMQRRLFRLHRSHLKEKDAGDDLQVARNMTLHLLQQRFALLQQRRQPPFGGTPVGDVFNCLGY